MARSRSGGRVLLVEDDEVIREATQLVLARYGFEVATAADGLAGLELFRADPPSVVIIDVMLPGLDGVSLCRRVREDSEVPVLMISARTDPVDVVSGLEAGADDYITKPYDSAVLVARIRAIMRRADMGDVPESAEAQARPATPRIRAVGDLEIDLDGMEVRLAGRPVTVTPTELRLLLEFTATPGVVLTREMLLERVWDYAWGGDSRVVDVHVQRLRGKIGAGRIETVRGFGYKFRR
jgi:two-component system, OmpR family, response regulator MtrA